MGLSSGSLTATRKTHHVKCCNENCNHKWERIMLYHMHELCYLENLNAYNMYDRYVSHQSRGCGPMIRVKCRCMVYMHVCFVNDNDYMVHNVNYFGESDKRDI